MCKSSLTKQKRYVTAPCSRIRQTESPPRHQLPQDIEWHFIGGLQSNKCKALAGQCCLRQDRESKADEIAGQPSAIPNLFAIETLDSLKSTNLLEKALAANPPSLDPSRRLNVFLQINTSCEDAKSGLPPLSATLPAGDGSDKEAKDLVSLSKHIISQCPHLRLKGLMTIGSFTASYADGENPDFISLIETRDRLLVALKELNVEGASDLQLELSMGMSADFEKALRAGSDTRRWRQRRLCSARHARCRPGLRNGLC